MGHVKKCFSAWFCKDRALSKVLENIFEPGTYGGTAVRPPGTEIRNSFIHTHMYIYLYIYIYRETGYIHTLILITCKTVKWDSTHVQTEIERERERTHPLSFLVFSSHGVHEDLKGHENMH